jgi:hypothetical protein
MCLHPQGMTTGAPPHQQQLHRHPGATAATLPPTPAAKSSPGYNGSALIFMGHRVQSTTKTLPYPTKLQLKSNCNRSVYIFDTYLTQRLCLPVMCYWLIDRL